MVHLVCKSQVRISPGDLLSCLQRGLAGAEGQRLHNNTQLRESCLVNWEKTVLRGAAWLGQNGSACARRVGHGQDTSVPCITFVVILDNDFLE